MKYIALTKGFVEWALPKIGILASLYEALREIESDEFPLNSLDFFQDAIRISYDEKSGVCAIWHSDYLSGTSSEDWGIIRWSGDYSILSTKSIAREVLERCLYVLNQRLQGLLIDGSMIHRGWANGTHTLLAGRGSIAHQLSIGYFEDVQGEGSLLNRACIIVGPEVSFQKLQDLAYSDGRNLNKLCAVANSLINIRSSNKSIAGKEVFSDLREQVRNFFDFSQQDLLFGNVEVKADGGASTKDHARYFSLGYDDWVDLNGPLGDAKRRILNSLNIDSHPLRIIGPGGSGKTLLMLLLAVSKIRKAMAENRDVKILYVAHSKAMAGKIIDRFKVLLDGDDPTLMGLQVTTLAEFCIDQLGLDVQSTLDTDGDAAKEFQLDRVFDALSRAKEGSENLIVGSRLLTQVFSEDRLLRLFAQLVLVEISISIKGHGLEGDRKRYVESEKGLSLLHSNLNVSEREFVYNVFQIYHRDVFEGYLTLDPDDIAISLAGRLRTPVWQLRRKKEGFDYVFIDEAQLFNENERRLFSFLTKTDTPHVPIALALDQAQAIYGQSSAGLSVLGIKGISNESLVSIHRSTESIIKLAFFVIQRSTELFGPDFPDFTKSSELMVPDSYPLAAKPVIEEQSSDSQDFGKFVLKRVRDLRRSNIRQIAVVCYAENYWSSLEECMSNADLPFQIITERGAKFPTDRPMVSLVKPSLVGGQEFDAVILVGLEAGVIPPVINDNLALSNAIEQQTIRDMYLGITRARYRVMVVLSRGAQPNRVIQQAKDANLIE
ncbi:hypothetical protein CFN79_09345 [Chromobacterium vaccinii]|uniref:UvrD-helicase domain-containing protein n=1 Tax=Chromobacterium vaccinii TaxID=1108595 RepID=UPI000CE94D60|nr:UvrD-helicase domain-containing protein [Chromobacterium vaccinii]AVG16040.1 hypothetical protein CFN79_09345 [Chromobacterium vaccinii]